MANRINAYRVTILASLLGAGCLFAGCSSDSNSPNQQPSNLDDSGTGGKTGSTGGKTGSTGGGGATSTGGKTSVGGTDGGSPGGAANDAGTGGAAGGGSGGANPGDAGGCTAPQNGTFNGTPATTTEFLNHCTNSSCIPFDNTGLPNPLPSL